MQVPRIENIEIVTKVFGEWPSFRDGEIVRLTLDRSGPEGPRLEALIYVFLPTGEIDEQGLYMLRHESLVALEFMEVVVEKIAGFNHQNVIFEVIISEIDPAENDGRCFEVNIEGPYGCTALFKAKRIFVRDLIPHRTKSVQTPRRERLEH
ncbi:MAG: hypothetical protein C4520_01210 [Candidatus Abyssobacteria bacterium SURF_5]|uniref:Uncharacterized protein n=1 Tax=Abyssobacteria bacterium (strain SURF_5) TaxID=2093360 RepID=A0A3A4PDM1_ABYX5|nr:MAG: hypothetical protein C4520_01210 [Candidatus Abyssubacteria bacterium SURF_5]